MADLNETDLAQTVTVPEVKETASFDNDRYKELAEANGIDTNESPTGETDGKVDPVAKPAGESTAAEPHAEAKTGQEKNWKDTAESNKWPKGFRKELDRMERQRERERQEFRQKSEEWERKLAEFGKKQEKKATVTRKNFATDEEYVNHLTDQRVEQREMERQGQQMQTERQLGAFREARATWEAKVNKHFTDEQTQSEYQEAVESLGDLNSTLNDQINSYIVKSPAGPLLLKYLADRPSVINTLKDMHEWDLASALQQIAQYTIQSKVAATAPQKPTAAPAPVGRVGKGTPGTMTKSEDEMTDEEALQAYRAKRRDQ